mmetsp:Transcript_6173/g.16043  ORF Transcript_6173/g.16043 Transcript_6173/m.16043 type:complete len:327 (+) Transcript_6173:809-1789(+)
MLNPNSEIVAAIREKVQNGCVTDAAITRLCFPDHPPIQPRTHRRSDERMEFLPLEASSHRSVAAAVLRRAQRAKPQRSPQLRAAQRGSPPEWRQGAQRSAPHVERLPVLHQGGDARGVERIPQPSLPLRALHLLLHLLTRRRIHLASPQAREPPRLKLRHGWHAAKGCTREPDVRQRHVVGGGGTQNATPQLRAHVANTGVIKGLESSRSHNQIHARHSAIVERHDIAINFLNSTKRRSTRIQRIEPSRIFHTKTTARKVFILQIELHPRRIHTSRLDHGNTSLIQLTPHGLGSVGIWYLVKCATRHEICWHITKQARYRVTWSLA